MRQVQDEESDRGRNETEAPDVTKRLDEITVDQVLPWLMQALAPFGEARAAVVKAIDRLTGRTGGS